MRRKNPKRTVPTLNYYVNSFSDYKTISNMQDTRKLVFNNLIEAIEDSMRSKKNEASIFMLDYDHYVSLNKRSWTKSLKTAIEFFSSEGVEEYEVCKKCVDLIRKIESEEKIMVGDE